MKRIFFLLVALAMTAGILAVTATASGHADEEAAPIYGVKLPDGYRDWKMISIAQVGVPLNDLRVKLGNDVAIQAFRDDTRPFPDGTIITACLSAGHVRGEQQSLSRFSRETRPAA